MAGLASFNFEIKYRPGRHDTDVDTLSRFPTQEDWKITSEAVQAICNSMIPKYYVECLAISPEVIPDDDLVATDINSMVDWVQVQALDYNIRQILNHLESPTR